MTIWNRFVQCFLASPLTWGAMLTLAFYGVVRGGGISGDLIDRYFLSHPVEYVMTFMFLTGVASLGLKTLDVARQRRSLGQALFGAAPGADTEPSCDELFNRLEALPPRQQEEYRTRRLRSALEYIEHKGTAEGLDEELKYLAEQDATAAYNNYGLIRTITWSIPILGFLGTVIGIAVAMGSLNPDELSQSLPTVMAGLMVAFDTTTLALALSIVLVFSHFFVDRQETRLLGEVDRQVAAELLGRFPTATGGAGEAAWLRGALREVVQASQQLVVRQAEIWQESIEAANTRFARLVSDAGQEVRATLGPALSEGIRAHAQELAAAETRMAEFQQQTWQRWQTEWAGGVDGIRQLQEAVQKQLEVLGRVLEATGEVTTLEDRLNHNLAALSSVGNFEQTVNSLAAAIHLLNNRLTGGDGPKVRLETPAKKGNAA